MKVMTFLRAMRVLGVLCVLYGIAVAQLGDQAIYGRDATQVYVRDSAIAVEKFALAERMERLREWSKAADVYQEVLTGYADRVVASQVDKDNRIVQYTSVVPAVQERLSRWPAEGLAAYRARYETEAQALLDDAKSGDLAPLHKAYSTYFVTEAGKIAGLRLIDAHLEAGEFAAAAWTADRLLQWHPGLDADRPRLLYRAALAHHLSGNDALATAKRDELLKSFPDALGKVRGQDVRLADSLSDVLKLPRPVGARQHGDGNESWPVAFGSPDRSRLSAAVGEVGANVFSIELVRAESSMPRATQAQLERTYEAERRAGTMTGVYPVLDRGELFFQDNARVYAVSLESGLPLPGWAETYGGELAGRYTAPGAVPTPRNQHYTITLTDDAVLAVMGHADPTSAAMTGVWTPRDTRLVCLDRRTGRERWTVRPRQLPESAGNARDLDFSGSPLVVGDNVYVLGRGGKGMQFEDCYVLCLAREDGKLKWASYLASANVAGQAFDFDATMSGGQSVSHLAYSSGRLFCNTNLGAVAAVGAYDGTIAWLNVYPREDAPAGPIAMRRMGYRQRQTEKPWAFNPVIVSDGKVFVLPNDAKHAHVYDAGNGAEIKRVALSSFEGASALLGVSGDRLVVASESKIFCVNWPKYDPAAEPVKNLFWRTNELRRGGGAGAPGAAGAASALDEGIRGRAFVAADSVFVPTGWQLLRLSLSSGKTLSSYPATGQWSEDEGPGNVLATAEHVVIAGPTRVNAYTDLALAVRKLESAVAAAPSDPEPRLRYAEIMFVSGRLDVALAKLDEAIELLGGRAALTAGPNRERLFADALGFAQKLASNARGATRQTIDGLFDRAAAAAATPAQHVNLRLSRAEFARSVNDAATELRLYQEILVDPQLRGVTVARGESGGARQAGFAASDAIAELLRRPDGKALYEPFEALAAQSLEAKRSGADPTALLEIAQAYPNSNAAQQALLLAADAFEASSNPRQATQALRQLYFRYPDAPDRARVIEGIARNYLALPLGLDVAAARLAQGAKLQPSAKLSRPMRLPDGQVLKDMTFAEALAAIRKVQSTATARSLPDLRLPRPFNVTRDKPFGAEPDGSTVENVASIFTPARDFAGTRLDRVITFAAGTGLSVYSSTAPGKPLFTSPATGDAPPRGVGWTGGNLLAWNERSLTMIDGSSGGNVWQIVPDSLPAVEVISGGSDGALASLDAGEGAAEVDPAVAAGIAAMQARGMANAQVIVNGRRVLAGGRIQIRGAAGVAQVRVMNARGEMVLVQPNAGAPADQAVPAGAVVPPNAAAGAGAEHILFVQPLTDRVILATSTGRVVAADLNDGRVLWQTRIAKAAVERLLATDDFVVLKTGDGGTSSQLVALDSFGGQPVFRKSFAGRDAMTGLPLPLNVALAGDGTLVWVLPDRVVGKDLFDTSDALRFGAAPPAGAPRRDGVDTTFVAAIGPDRFMVADGRIIAVCENGEAVRVLSLETGRTIRNDDGAEMRMASGASNPTGGDVQVTVRVVGPMLYVFGPQSVRAYDLERPGDLWQAELMDPRDNTSCLFRDAAVTRDHLLVFAVPQPRAGARPPGVPPPARRLGAGGAPANAVAPGTDAVRVFSFSRASLDGSAAGAPGDTGSAKPPSRARESGVFEFVQTLWPDPVRQIQAVDGGVFFLTADQKLHFLPGAGSRS
jgi:outer membrane protein assembly factor BamB